MDARTAHGDLGRTRVSVFDFDGTVIDGQSGALFTTYLLRRHMLPTSCVLRLGCWGVRYKLHLPYRQEESRELVFRAFDGLTAPEVDAIMTSFHEEVLVPRYRPRAVAEFDRRNAEGDVTLLVSATFEPIARAAAGRLGADGSVATPMELGPDGSYTGRVGGSVIAGAEKYRAAAAWCDEHLGRGRWELSSAYADHHSDEDLLARAAHPFAVCPGSTLRPIARRNGWPILDWND